MQHGDGGKGSERRPGDGYQDGWDRIFGRKSAQQEKNSSKPVPEIHPQMAQPVGFSQPIPKPE